MKDNNLLVKQLIDFGLSDKEAKVYLALLELGLACMTESVGTPEIRGLTKTIKK